MRTYVMTATLSAATLTLSLALAVPALARGGDHAGGNATGPTDLRSNSAIREADKLRIAGLACSSTWAMLKPSKPSG